MTKINQSFIDKLKPTGKQEQISLGYKLFLIMTPKGTKSYRYIFRKPDTKTIKKKNLGNACVISLEAALSMALSFNALLEQGLDPIEHNKSKFEVKNKQLIKLDEIIEDWKITKGKRLSKKHLHDRLPELSLEELESLFKQTNQRLEFARDYLHNGHLTGANHSFQNLFEDLKKAFKWKSSYSQNQQEAIKFYYRTPSY